MKDICTVTIKAPAQPLLTDRGDVIIAMAKLGKGTVLAVAPHGCTTNIWVIAYCHKALKMKMRPMISPIGCQRKFQ
jgi:hypothetical protein